MSHNFDVVAQTSRADLGGEPAGCGDRGNREPRGLSMTFVGFRPARHRDANEPLTA